MTEMRTVILTRDMRPSGGRGDTLLVPAPMADRLLATGEVHDVRPWPPQAEPPAVPSSTRKTYRTKEMTP